MEDMFADSDEEDNPVPPSKYANEDLFSLLTARTNSGAKRKPEKPAAENSEKKPKDVSVPETQTVVHAQVETRLAIASAEDRGSRSVMEDVWVIQEDARRDKKFPLRITFCGIFDGHGGVSSARYASETLHEEVMKCGLLTEITPEGTVSIKRARQAVLEGFKQTDQKLLAVCAEKGWSDGATAVTVWLVGETVLVANIGDARCVLARRPDKALDHGELKALVLTKDHKAIYPVERSRIEKQGGVVTSDGRLEGRIEVSRAFGDRQFKKKGMIAVPEIQTFAISQRDEFLLCGCDGFWSVFDPKDAVATAERLLKEGRDVKSCCNRIINEAIRERRCKDNCTILMIKFLRNNK